jgi:AraC-like DNA-binding protein
VGRKIGKTRQRAEAKTEEVFDASVGKGRGILRRPPPEGAFRHARLAAPKDLAPWVENYWMVKWDLEGLRSYLAETLPHPSFQLVFENGKATVSGVFQGKFSRVLEGASHVFGVKFRPGAFRAFLKKPALSLTNRTIAAKHIFGKEVNDLAEVVKRCDGETEMAETATVFLRARLPEKDETIALAGEIVRRVLRQREIKTVEDLAAQTGIQKRSLQRIFREQVGVNPKWVIRRYRLHELAEQIQSGAKLDWAQLALELGYFDQAHLINDFKKIVGCTPMEYRRQLGEKERG